MSTLQLMLPTHGCRHTEPRPAPIPGIQAACRPVLLLPAGPVSAEDRSEGCTWSRQPLSGVHGGLRGVVELEADSRPRPGTGRVEDPRDRKQNKAAGWAAAWWYAEGLAHPGILEMGSSR